MKANCGQAALRVTGDDNSTQAYRRMSRRLREGESLATPMVRAGANVFDARALRPRVGVLAHH